MDHLANDLQKSGFSVSSSAFFDATTYSARAADLLTLLDYIVYAASELHVDRERALQASREERRLRREA